MTQQEEIDQLKKEIKDIFQILKELTSQNLTLKLNSETNTENIKLTRFELSILTEIAKEKPSPQLIDTDNSKPAEMDESTKEALTQLAKTMNPLGLPRKRK